MTEPVPHAAAEHPPSRAASPRSLFMTWLALMVLAAVSLVLRFAHLGGYGFLCSLGIAGIKAVLVALVFMELAFERPTIRFAFAAGLLLFTVMLALIVADVLTRQVPPMEDPPGTAPRYRG